MAELTELDEKVAEVYGLSQAAQNATEKVSKLVDDEKIVGAMNEQVGEQRVQELFEWAKPIQQRHFEQTRECALQLARQEA